ncbi:MAG: molybdenum ABC transporter ATP-binding protein, partial [Gammaproteobacteria bacterium]|nr:molybdenum ABC transporter ATP-binding protein [Gammaproteobacteria bacterium]
MASTIRLDVRHRLGRFELDASFEAGRGITALFGRSGAGKTSIVNIVAGLLRPAHGRVEVEGRVLVDTERGIHVPAHRRRIGYVFQEGRLFPHLDVRRNLMFGSWFTPRGERVADPDTVVDMLGLAGLLARRPAHLSGGEKQRVAIGRALLSSPRLLIMDEPLASLDAQRKEEVLPYLERLRDELRVPILYVSHALSEISRIADTIVLVSDGRVVTGGPVSDVLARADLFPLTGRHEAGAVIDAIVESHDERYELTELSCAGG